MVIFSLKGVFQYGYYGGLLYAAGCWVRWGWKRLPLASQMSANSPRITVASGINNRDFSSSCYSESACCDFVNLRYEQGAEIMMTVFEVPEHCARRRDKNFLSSVRFREVGEYWVVLVVNLSGMPLNYSLCLMPTKIRKLIELKILFSPLCETMTKCCFSQSLHTSNCSLRLWLLNPKHSFLRTLGITIPMHNIWTPEGYHVDIFTPISMPEEFLMFYQSHLRWHFCCAYTTSCKVCPPLVQVAPVTVILITYNSNDGL